MGNRQWPNYALLIALTFLAGIVKGQHVLNYEIKESGFIELADEISIPKINSGYTCWLPEAEQISGLIVFFHARRDTLNADIFIEYALKNKLGVLYVTTENRVDFLFDDKDLEQLETYISEVVDTYEIPSNKIMYCGMSLAGTRALRLTKYALSSNTVKRLKPLAIAIFDAPLDMIRFYRECQKAINQDYSPIAVNEATWVSSCLRKHLGGSPEECKTAFLDYSPFSNDQMDYSYLNYLDGIALRAYTEPDVQWWMSNRQKDFYGMNALDMAGLINALQIRKHANANLITTRNKGFRPDGSRHPHSWSIVNEKELIDWFVELIRN